jgi:hypothetical protein
MLKLAIIEHMRTKNYDYSVEIEKQRQALSTALRNGCGCFCDVAGSLGH